MDYTGFGDAPPDDLSLRQAWANMLRGMTNKQSWQDLGQSIQNTAQIVPNVAESVARGGVAGTVGALGGIRDMKNSINSYLPESVQNWQAGMETLSNPMARALIQKSPNPEAVYEAVPRVTSPYEGYKQHETIGEYVGPPAAGLLADALKFGKGLPVGASIKAVDELPIPKPVEKTTFTPEKNELGFYSALEDAVGNIKQEKGTGQQFLNQISKTAGVKPEEISVTGLDKFLAENPKTTRKDILEYLSNNRTKLQETVLDENRVKAGTYEDYQIKDAEAIDDQDWISSNADDLSYEYRNDPNMVEQTRQELLAKDPEKYADWETHPTNAEKLQKDVDQELDNLAYDHATANYWEDPIYRSIDDFGYEVIGNDNMGYSIKDQRGKWLDKSFNDFSDAEAYLRDRHLDNGDLVLEEQGPRHAGWQTEGPSENYREVLIQLPENQGKPFVKESHFEEPNIVVHLRVNDRNLGGKKTLFIEEVQSDWHQAGRKEGYVKEISKERRNEIEKEMANLSIEKTILRGDADKQAAAEGYKYPYNSSPSKQLTDLYDQIKEIEKKQLALDNELKPTGVADAPFKENWHELAMKRAMQMAAEGGYERVAFTTGAQQADRYNLSKHIKSASYKDGQLQAYNKEGALVVNKAVEPNKLEEYVGKDLAKTMVENAKKDEEIRKAYREAIKNDAPQSEIDRLQDALNQSKTDYSGLDFQVGGEFHKMLYDKKIPDFVNKYGKKYGMKVGDVKLRYEKGRAPADYETQAAQNLGLDIKDWFSLSPADKMRIHAEAEKLTPKETVHYFDITPEAKTSLLEKGSPLFAAPAIGLTGEESRREILEKLMGK